MRRERLNGYVAARPSGPYTLLRVERGGLEPGVPGQFFMLEAPGRLLPRPMSLCLAPPGELAFLIDPIGPGTQALVLARAGRLDPRLRPARERLPARRRAAAARRRRDRDRAAAVPLAAARRAAGRARLPLGVARGGGRARAERRGRRSTRRSSPSCSGTASAAPTCSPAARSRCSRRCASCAPARSSPGRRRWPAATAPATAARSRSTASGSASASKGRCAGRLAAQRLRLPRRADRARDGASARRLRDEDGDAAPARREPARPDRRDRRRDAELDRPRQPGPRALPRRDAAAAARARRCRSGSRSAASPRSEYAETCARLEDVTIELNLSCPNVDEAPESAAEIVAACRAATTLPLYAKLSPASWDIAEVARAVEAAGADGLSLVNTMRGMKLDAELRPVLGTGDRRALRPGAQAGRARRRPRLLPGDLAADRGHGRGRHRDATRSSSSRPARGRSRSARCSSPTRPRRPGSGRSWPPNWQRSGSRQPSRRAGLPTKKRCQKENTSIVGSRVSRKTPANRADSTPVDRTVASC